MGVSGIKNKMGVRVLHFYSNSSYPKELTLNNTKSDKSVTKNFILSNISEDFLFWFSGFTDGEGNFLITLDRDYVKFRFKITLHIDDIETLNTIKSKLKIGRVTVESNRNRCAFIVEKHEDIKNIICPIFNTFPLHTSKRLDFEDFYKAFLIKDSAREKSLCNMDKERIVSLKNGMNLKRSIFTYQITDSQIIINPNWFIGFLEGEGTFGIKTGSSVYFQIAQKNTSQESLNAITTFLTRLSSPLQEKEETNNTLQLSKILPLNVVCTTNKKTDVISLVVSSVDSLFYYLLPFLDSSKMYTRKAIDFKLWRVALLLKIHGYYFLTEGKKLFLDISEVINKRYSTTSTDNIDYVITNIFNRSKSILSKDPIFDVKSNKSHIDNVREYYRSNKSENIVYIYKDKQLVKGSPFASFSAAHKALGLKPSSNTCNRYIDTNRLYKKEYIFTSKPLDIMSKD